MRPDPGVAAELPSERAFGLTFGAIFAAVAAYGMLAAWARGAVAGLCAAALAFSLLAIVAPRFLAPLNRGWFHLGRALARVVNPVVLAVIFFGLLTPVALMGRLLGRDELRLKRRDVPSYWIDRTPPGPEGASFKNQF